MDRIFYIEQKTGYSDDGPAWIGFVKQSRNGKTIYFNGKAFRKSGRGSHYDIETGEVYWISGVKKSGRDGWGDSKPKVWIEQAAVSHYLKLRGLSTLSNRFKVFVPIKTPIEKFRKIDNERSA